MPIVHDNNLCSVQQRIMVKEILSRVVMPFYAVPVSEWGNLEVN